ncbi:Cytochrome P450 2J5 [Sciurus carolinensis]|uniref:Cytochrome P450 2J5 n=1 Tax=Sciurus carolinensis TaxID=30640 RepID=A0AA41NA47_SCICA|nr:Cytochrome P450 2J5 [Sciurus carolinensis]
MLAAVGSLATAFWAAFHARTLLLGAVAFLFFADFFKRRRPKNYPPGPWPLPLFGNFFHVDFENSHVAVQLLVKKYGNILSLDFGNLSSVLITGLPLIKEVLSNTDQYFVNRPLTPLRARIFGKNGLIMSNGQIWKEQRRFTLTTLRNFGLGRKSLEERIQEEAYHLIEAIKEENGQPFNPHFKINNAVSNIICSITFGERFEYHNAQFQELLKLLDEVTCLEASKCCQLYGIFPWIMKFLPGPHQTVFSNWDKLKLFVSREVEKHKKDWNPDESRDFIDAYLKEIEKLYGIFPWIMKFLPGPHQTVFSNWDKLKLFVSREVEKHKKDWNPDESRDFIDAYLKEIEKYTGKNASSFHEENLICSTLDLFFAGTETTSTTLRWGLLYLALYPEVQEKVHAEIDRVLGPWQQPSMAARESMPYTNAVIHEVQRMGNIIPLNVPREVVADTTLAGYYLPKGTMILTNLTALHKDPTEWATPDTFNPEHFLENGQFKKREAFLPFSMGKRACLGEQLAKSELFIFFTSLAQKFTFKPPDNEKLSLKFRMGLTVSPVSHRICAIPRE